MARFRCNGCGAVYRNPLRDGSSYFHVCAPQIIVRARREDGSEIEQPLEQFAGLVIVQSRAERDELVNSGTPAASIVIERTRRLVRRPGHRDENTRERRGERGELRIMKAEGAGATALATDQDVAAEDSDAV